MRIVKVLVAIPMILLFKHLGLPPYVATVICTALGYIISISIVLIYLKKNMNFKYTDTLNTLKKLILPTIVLLVPIIISKHFIHFEYTRVTSIISLFIYGMYGVIVYLLITYKNGALYSVFGEEFVNNILKKLHLIK